VVFVSAGTAWNGSASVVFGSIGGGPGINLKNCGHRSVVPTATKEIYLSNSRLRAFGSPCAGASKNINLFRAACFSAIFLYCHPERGCRVEGPPRSDSPSSAANLFELPLFFLILVIPSKAAESRDDKKEIRLARQWCSSA
jgi:hypothetical protein